MVRAFAAGGTPSHGPEARATYCRSSAPRRTLNRSVGVVPTKAKMMLSALGPLPKSKILVRGTKKMSDNPSEHVSGRGRQGQSHVHADDDR